MFTSTLCALLITLNATLVINNHQNWDKLTEYQKRQRMTFVVAITFLIVVTLNY